MKEKALTLRQASECENARLPVCRCRCGGKLHGAGRGGATPDTAQAFFESLPADDPHRLPTATELQAAKTARQEAKRLERDAAQRRKWDMLAGLGSEL